MPTSSSPAATHLIRSRSRPRYLLRTMGGQMTSTVILGEAKDRDPARLVMTGY
jgi:hypothetical protein